MQSLALDKVLENAFGKVKERWWRALLVEALGIGLVFVIGLLLILFSAFVIAFSFSALKPVAPILTAVVVLADILLFILIGGWIGLSYVKVLIDEDKIGPFEAFSKTRPLIGKYTVFLLLQFLFFVGLSVYLFIPIFIWVVWAILTVFVFLNEEENRTGLRPLFMSKELVKGNYFKILALMLLLWGVSLLFGVISLNSKTIMVLWNIFSFTFFAPFTVLVYHEVYKQLREFKPNAQPTTAKVSLVLSFVGWIFIVLAGYKMVGFMLRQRGMYNIYRKQRMLPFEKEGKRRDKDVLFRLGVNLKGKEI